MTIDLIRTCERAIDEKWDKPEALRLLMFGLLEHIAGMERRSAGFHSTTTADDIAGARWQHDINPPWCDR